MEVKTNFAVVQSANPDGSGIEIQLNPADRNIVHVKNATGRTIVPGQRVLVHWRLGEAITEIAPVFITSILTGEVD